MTENTTMSDTSPDTPSYACLDVLPEAPSSPADLPDGVLGLAIPNDKFWDTGRTLDVHFQNGTDDQKAQFRAAASEWSKHANILLRFDTSVEDSEIRVNFGNQGNWSYVGTDNLKIAKTSTTMAIQNMSSIRHEVGHALGCIHEHQQPDADIQWNKPVVYQALGGPPNNWSHAQVDQNVFDKYAKATTQFSVFDPNSIMLYAFPASWTLNGVGTHSNSALSGTDKAFINRAYPGCTANFSKSTIGTAACTVTTGPGTMFNQYYGNSWIMNQPNTSYIEVRFNQPKKFEGKDIYSAARLRMVHLTSMLDGKAGHSPVDIVLNGKVIKENYSPPSGNYMTDEWDVAADLVDGDNVLRINFKSATSSYWINQLQVICDRIIY